MSHSYEILYIDSNEKLASLCKQLASSDLLVIDTEFVREKTYRARLCLIQIASADIIACVDPLAIDNLKPLMDIIYDEEKLKVLHAARQDYEIFYDLNGKLPSPVFDSQLAASLLGYGEQIGYANLVQKLLNKQLDKGHARTDWSRRPLNPDQIKYAADDVYYLRDVYKVLVDKLIETGREDWLTDDFNELCQPGLYITEPGDAWKRVKGINRLKPRQLAAAQHLAAWREELAIEKNKPRRWILADDLIVAIAQMLPAQIDRLNTIANFNRALSEKHGKDIIRIIQQVQNLANDELPEPVKFKRLTTQQENMTDLLMLQLKISAFEQDISPSNIASKKDIEKMVTGDTQLPLLSGWRYQLAGKKLESMLKGEHGLAIKNNKVVLT